ncbi:hypothetical protein CWS31_002885 [Colwellia echini]|uniref:Carbohydrate-binding domain-containing protein n=2 Tax=Colwellia echini TaxID=1982103 RepID=A0ABY3N0F2_9GAMM|nr:hypothetical protein CWS31_002885 [Colwellia echini]
MPDWQNIEALNINQFPWYETGLQQQTQVKLCANNDTLFLQINAQDKYSYAKQTQLNHMLICQDSCVEFFFSPSGILGNSYLNVEVNCCGTLHLAYGGNRDNRRFISPEIARKIKSTSTINTLTKIENDTDSSWTIELAIPFSVIEQLTEEKVNKEKWFANFYRCGGRIEPQYAVWNNIEVSTPDYHRPEFFGELYFVS